MWTGEEKTFEKNDGILYFSVDNRRKRMHKRYPYLNENDYVEFVFCRFLLRFFFATKTLSEAAVSSL